jgi:predicted ATPase
MQQALCAEPWPAETPLRVRMALHTGEADLREGDYYGSVVNRCARLRAIAYGGQILVSQATHDLVRDALPAGVRVRELGEHRLAGLRRAEQVYQLLAEGARADFPPLRSPASAPNNLPLQPTSFVGREREIAAITQALSTTRLLTLTGAGGAGKTRLALQVAADLVEDYPDGVWFVDLAPLADPALVPATAAAALGVRDAAERPAQEALVAVLQARSALLLLDNCEHLLAACAALADALVRGCPRLRVLATSRASLGIAGETVRRVPSLTLPERSAPAPLERLTQYEAVRLFIERAVAARGDFQVSNATAPALAEICWRLDGIPLAIELAAARVRVLSLEQLARRLDDRFRLLTAGSRTALPRQQTLRALVDWSYSLLAEGERALLRRLSIFAGGWALEAAEAVCTGEGLAADEVLDVLARLVDQSLVVAEELPGAAGAEGEVRYRLLETIRQYAAEKLAAAGEEAGLAARHARYFTALAEEATPHLTRAEQLAWLARLDREGDNLRAVLGWCVGQGNAGDSEAAELGLRLGGALRHFWFLRAQLREAQAWLHQLLILPTAATRTPHRAMALGTAAFFTGMVEGGSATATALFEESLVLARETGRIDVAAAVLVHAQLLVPDPVRRQTLLEEGVALGRTLSDSTALRMALLWLGIHHLLAGDQSLARDYCARSRAASVAVGDRWITSIACDGLANVARARGDMETAQQLFAEELTLHRELGDKHGIGHTLLFIGELAEEQGDIEGAATCYAEALAMLRDAWDPGRLTAVLRGVAALALARAQPARALRLAGAAAAVQQNLWSPEGWERIAEEARQRLTPEAAAATWEEGRAMPLEQAIAYALEQSGVGIAQ